MEEKTFSIDSVLIDYLENPLGLDDSSPTISWKLRAGKDCRNIRQKAYRILVGSREGASDLWDSGVRESDCSAGVVYEGEALKPKTMYYVAVTVWDESGNQDISGSARFETGFLDPSVKAWGGAGWIGAPEKYVNARTLGVFVLSCDIRFPSGNGKAGIVFGADDERLLDSRKNRYEIAGENAIRYVLNVTKIPADLEIYRIGYAPKDTQERPFAVIPVLEFGTAERRPVITQENRTKAHNLRVEVVGDCAYAYVDGLLVDALEFTLPTGETMRAARPLNPLGFNDVTTFPRMCGIGYYVEAGSEAEFGDLIANHYRTPGREIARIAAPGVIRGGGVGKDLSDMRRNVSGMCQDSAAAGQNVSDIRQDSADAAQNVPDMLQNSADVSRNLSDMGPIPVVVKRLPSGTQLTYSVSCHSIPMLRRDFVVSYEKEIAKARLYITARGCYDCRINGSAVTDTRLNPGSMQYDKRIQYQTYDVAGLLRKGENGIGITLSSGWWCDAQTFALRNYNYFGDQESVLARL